MALPLSWPPPPALSQPPRNVTSRIGLVGSTILLVRTHFYVYRGSDKNVESFASWFALIVMYYQAHLFLARCGEIQVTRIGLGILNFLWGRAYSR